MPRGSIARTVRQAEFVRQVRSFLTGQGLTGKGEKQSKVLFESPSVSHVTKVMTTGLRIYPGYYPEGTTLENFRQSILWVGVLLDWCDENGVSYTSRMQVWHKEEVLEINFEVSQ